MMEKKKRYWTMRRVKETDWLVEPIGDNGGYPYKVWDPKSGKIMAQTMSKLRGNDIAVVLKRYGRYEE